MRPSEMAVHLPRGIEISKDRHWHSLAFIGIGAEEVSVLGMDFEVLHDES